MKVLQIATIVQVALICCCLCSCTSTNSAGPPKVIFGFLPSDLSLTSRSTVPALTTEQATEKGMSQLEALHRVLPEHEVIDFAGDNAIRVIHVHSGPQEMQRDYAGFAKGLESMRDFINSNPAAYPESRQPDFLYVNAGLYVRAKFRSLALPWGKAVVMLVQYTQGTHPPPPNSDDLRIWIRGISNGALHGGDGFCISGGLTVKHPQLKPRDAACAEIEGQDEEEALVKAEKQLDTYDDESFTPSLRDIERMLRELKVEPSRSS